MLQTPPPPTYFLCQTHHDPENMSQEPSHLEIIYTKGNPETSIT